MNYTFPDKNSNTTAWSDLLPFRSVDIDGKSELSFVRSVRIGKKNERGINILIYPNPISTELRITIPTKWQDQKVSYELFNQNGQVAMKNIVRAASQTEKMSINSLAPGFMQTM